MLRSSQGLVWISADLFNKFTMKHSRANPTINSEDQSLAESEDIILPLLEQSKPSTHPGMSDAILDESRMDLDSISRKVSTRMISVANSEDVTGLAGLKSAKRRGSINASISNHIMDMALKHEDGDEEDHFVSKNRTLSGGFVVHPDAHHDDEHESHQIVKKAITKAARRVSHVDPLMGTHGSVSSGGRHSHSPYGRKTAPVMRPVGKIEINQMSSKISDNQPNESKRSSSPEVGEGWREARERRRTTMLTQSSRKKSMSNLTLNLSEQDLIKLVGEYSGTTPKKEGEKRKKRNSLL